jgi:phytoene synthase
MIDTSAFCAGVVREADRDRYLATLFVPEPARSHLYALYAFNAEVARIRELVSQPAPGEIRLTWWREVVEGERAEEAAGNPVASALLRAMTESKLPRQPFVDLLDARVLDLYDDPIPTLEDLEGYCGETSSALFRLASIIVAGGSDPGGADVAGHGGVAYALCGLMRALPQHAAQGQLFLPTELLARHGVRRDDVLSGRTSSGLAAALAELRSHARKHYEAAKAQFGTVRADCRVAFLALALVPGDLRRLERQGEAVFTGQGGVPQWRRQLTLWRAARRGRLP